LAPTPQGITDMSRILQENEGVQGDTAKVVPQGEFRFFANGIESELAIERIGLKPLEVSMLPSLLTGFKLFVGMSVSVLVIWSLGFGTFGFHPSNSRGHWMEKRLRSIMFEGKFFGVDVESSYVVM